MIAWEMNFQQRNKTIDCISNIFSVSSITETLTDSCQESGESFELTPICSGSENPVQPAETTNNYLIWDIRHLSATHNK